MVWVALIGRQFVHEGWLERGLLLVRAKKAIAVSSGMLVLIFIVDLFMVRFCFKVEFGWARSRIGEMYWPVGT